jgi:hypothetical protein
MEQLTGKEKMKRAMKSNFKTEIILFVESSM